MNNYNKYVNKIMRSKITESLGLDDHTICLMTEYFPDTTTYLDFFNSTSPDNICNDRINGILEANQ